MISVGAKNVSDAKRDLEYAAQKLKELGIISTTKIKVKLRNIVATGDMGQAVDIEKLSTKLPNIIYEPEQFPGAIYYAKELEGASILISSRPCVGHATVDAPCWFASFSESRRLDLCQALRPSLPAV